MPLAVMGQAPSLMTSEGRLAGGGSLEHRNGGRADPPTEAQLSGNLSQSQLRSHQTTNSANGLTSNAENDFELTYSLYQSESEPGNSEDYTFVLSSVVKVHRNE
jgi:hypothetical protein